MTKRQSIKCYSCHKNINLSKPHIRLPIGKRIAVFHKNCYGSMRNVIPVNATENPLPLLAIAGAVAKKAGRKIVKTGVKVTKKGAKVAGKKVKTGAKAVGKMAKEKAKKEVKKATVKATAKATKAKKKVTAKAKGFLKGLISNPDEPTPVVFRRWKGTKKIIALFPATQAESSGNIVGYYGGQYGDANYNQVISATKPAKPNEYKALLNELRQIGYSNLKIYQKWNPKFSAQAKFRIGDVVGSGLKVIDKEFNQFDNEFDYLVQDYSGDSWWLGEQHMPELSDEVKKNALSNPRIKGWKKTLDNRGKRILESSIIVGWSTPDDKTIIVKLREGYTKQRISRYDIIFDDGFSTKKLDFFNTIGGATKFAIDWMKKHPEGTKKSPKKNPKPTSDRPHKLFYVTYWELTTGKWEVPGDRLSGVKYAIFDTEQEARNYIAKTVKKNPKKNPKHPNDAFRPHAGTGIKLVEDYGELAFGENGYMYNKNHKLIKIHRNKKGNFGLGWKDKFMNNPCGNSKVKNPLQPKTIAKLLMSNDIEILSGLNNPVGSQIESSINLQGNYINIWESTIPHGIYGRDTIPNNVFGILEDNNHHLLGELLVRFALFENMDEFEKGNLPYRKWLKTNGKLLKFFKKNRPDWYSKEYGRIKEWKQWKKTKKNPTTETTTKQLASKLINKTVNKKNWDAYGYDKTKEHTLELLVGKFMWYIGDYKQPVTTTEKSRYINYKWWFTKFVAWCKKEGIWNTDAVGQIAGYLDNIWNHHYLEPLAKNKNGTWMYKGKHTALYWDDFIKKYKMNPKHKNPSQIKFDKKEVYYTDYIKIKAPRKGELVKISNEIGNTIYFYSPKSGKHYQWSKQHFLKEYMIMEFPSYLKKNPNEYPLYEFYKHCPSARYVGGVSKYLCECPDPLKCLGVKKAMKGYEPNPKKNPQFSKITQTGLKPLKKGIIIRPNRTYYMGASLSPHLIYVTKIDDRIIHYRSYPYHKDFRVQKQIGEHSIIEGMNTQIKNLQNWKKQTFAGEPDYYTNRIAKLKKKLAGKTTPIEDINDYYRVDWVVKGKKSAFKSSEDFYKYIESKYQISISGYGDYYADGFTTKNIVLKMRNDPKFVTVTMKVVNPKSTKKKSIFRYSVGDKLIRDSDKAPVKIVKAYIIKDFKGKEEPNYILKFTKKDIIDTMPHEQKYLDMFYDRIKKAKTNPGKYGTTNWEVVLIHKMRTKKIPITLGGKADKNDVYQQLKRMGIVGEVISIKKINPTHRKKGYEVYKDGAYEGFDTSLQKSKDYADEIGGVVKSSMDRRTIIYESKTKNPRTANEIFANILSFMKTAIDDYNKGDINLADNMRAKAFTLLNNSLLNEEQKLFSKKYPNISKILSSPIAFWGAQHTITVIKKAKDEASLFYQELQKNPLYNDEYRWEYLRIGQGHYFNAKNLTEAKKHAGKNADRDVVILQKWRPKGNKYTIYPPKMRGWTKEMVLRYYVDDGYDFNLMKKVLWDIPTNRIFHSNPTKNKSRKKKLDVFERHQLKIAKSTLKMHDVGALIMGGMSKQDARDFLKSVGYTSSEINKLEGNTVRNPGKKDLHVYKKFSPFTGEDGWGYDQVIGSDGREYTLRQKPNHLWKVGEKITLLDLKKGEYSKENLEAYKNTSKKNPLYNDEYRWEYLRIGQGHYFNAKNLSEAKKHAGKNADRDVVILQKWRPKGNKYAIYPPKMRGWTKEMVLRYYVDDGYDFNLMKKILWDIHSIFNASKKNPTKKKLDVFEKHQLKIAKSTLKMSDVGASIMGGMTKQEAKDFLKKVGYSSKEIKRFEANPKKNSTKLTIIPNSKNLDIRNLQALPRGTGARYLEVIKGLGKAYVAKQWRRKKPKKGIIIDLGKTNNPISPDEYYIRYGTKGYNLPEMICPNCESENLVRFKDGSLVCPECGHEKNGVKKSPIKNSGGIVTIRKKTKQGAWMYDTINRSSLKKYEKSGWELDPSFRKNPTLLSTDWLATYLRLSGIDPYGMSYDTQFHKFIDVREKQSKGDIKIIESQLKGIPQYHKVGISMAMNPVGGWMASSLLISAPNKNLAKNKLTNRLKEGGIKEFKILKMYKVKYPNTILQAFEPKYNVELVETTKSNKVKKGDDIFDVELEYKVYSKAQINPRGVPVGYYMEALPYSRKDQADRQIREYKRFGVRAIKRNFPDYGGYFVYAEKKLPNLARYHTNPRYKIGDQVIVLNKQLGYGGFPGTITETTTPKMNLYTIFFPEIKKRVEWSNGYSYLSASDIRKFTPKTKWLKFKPGDLVHNIRYGKEVEFEVEFETEPGNYRIKLTRPGKYGKPLSSLEKFMEQVPTIVDGRELYFEYNVRRKRYEIEDYMKTSLKKGDVVSHKIKPPYSSTHREVYKVMVDNPNQLDFPPYGKIYDYNKGEFAYYKGHGIVKVSSKRELTTLGQQTYGHLYEYSVMLAPRGSGWGSYWAKGNDLQPVDQQGAQRKWDEKKKWKAEKNPAQNNLIQNPRAKDEIIKNAQLHIEHANNFFNIGDSLSAKEQLNRALGMLESLTMTESSPILPSFYNIHDKIYQQTNPPNSMILSG